MKLKTLFWLPWLLVLVTTGCATRGPYQLIWQDDFNRPGTPDPANWNYERGFVRNHELQWYQPANAVCTNGLLVIEARPAHQPNPRYIAGSTNWITSREWINYTSASLTTRGRHEFKYGRIEMRSRIDIRPGSWPAFWTLGARPHTLWPAVGEVDIMEFYQSNVLANFGFSLDHHVKWLARKTPVAELGGDAWAQAFHIWTMDWDDQKIDLRLDGRLMNQLDLATANRANHGNPFHRPVYLILNQAIGGDCGGDPAGTTLPVRFEVDWVRVYQRDR